MKRGDTLKFIRRIEESQNHDSSQKDLSSFQKFLGERKTLRRTIILGEGVIPWVGRKTQSVKRRRIPTPVRSGN